QWAPRRGTRNRGAPFRTGPRSRTATARRGTPSRSRPAPGRSSMRIGPPAAEHAQRGVEPRAGGLEHGHEIEDALRARAGPARARDRVDPRGAAQPRADDGEHAAGALDALCRVAAARGAGVADEEGACRGWQSGEQLAEREGPSPAVDRVNRVV